MFPPFLFVYFNSAVFAASYKYHAPFSYVRYTLKLVKLKPVLPFIIPAVHFGFLAAELTSGVGWIFEIANIAFNILVLLFFFDFVLCVAG